ncbi:MAG: TIR domain-containing protein [Chloroflexi bacterium]|nr:TIR domain-containing protein [Chloroflexota bacterium]
MARRIFISCQYEDQMKAKGFNLLRWNKNVPVEFVGRHILDPVNSTNKDYISRKIREQLTGTSVTIVLIGDKTWGSGWVAYEVEQSLKKGSPNGILGIRLHDGVTVPDSLRECGAEIIDWKPDEFEAAMNRAALAAGRAKVAVAGPGGGSRCIR